MAQFFQTLSNVFSTLGAPVFVPIMLFIIAKETGAFGRADVYWIDRWSSHRHYWKL